MRGYFGVVAWKPKTKTNVGTLWRSAHVFGASFMGVIGARYRRQSSDTMDSARHVPFYEWETFEAFASSTPRDCPIVAVELCERAHNLTTFGHPERAVYLLGPEDGSLSPAVLALCHHRVVIPGTHCLNLAVAGSVVMYDRIAKGVEKSRRLTLEVA